MKKGLLLIFGLFALIALNPIVFAKSGCCSSHKGVDCNKIQSDGKVVCNDGWTGSSCAYSSMVMCEGYSPTTLGKGQQTPKIPTYIYGCTDKDSINYDLKANTNNGSCIKKIYGCMDENALNYNVLANISDEGCEYETEIPSTSVNEENDNEELTEIDSSQSDDGSDLLTGIVGLGALGSIGYFVIKRFKK